MDDIRHEEIKSSFGGVQDGTSMVQGIQVADSSS